MRTAKFSELTKKQFTPQSWKLFLEAKQQGHAYAVLIDFKSERKVGLKVIPRQDGTPFADSTPFGHSAHADPD
uniref:hypothetical protein n=1 Tax=Pseudomonas aeruginosa TaxID=287 RepID=UPI001161462C